MIESETTVGADLRITCSKDELVHGLSTVARALSTRTAIQILSGILLEAQRRRAATRCDGHGALGARDRAGAGAGRRVDRSSGPHARRHRAAAAGRRGDARASRLRVGRPRLLGQRELHAADVQRRGLPAPAGDRRDADVRGRARAAARDDRPCRARRVARRGAPGADRSPRPVRRRQARHGRDRLVSPCGQGDRARQRRRGARGDHPEPRAAGARAHRRRRRRDRRRRAGEPGHLLGRRRLARVAPHRRPVPEHPPASARGVRVRADDPARRAPRRRAARRA